MIEYTPNANANGSDSFTYTVSDGSITSSAATVSITINAVNDPPVATDDTKTINEDSAKVEINVITNDTDLDSTSLSVSAITTAPTEGTAAIKATDSKVIEYTPKANANGTDTIVYTVSDGSGGTDSGTLTITINALNDDPVFSDGTTAKRSVTVAGSVANSAVGSALGVTHPSDEAEALTFAIGGTDGSKFVVSSSGQISVGTTNLPVATHQTYTVTVTVRDSKNSAGTADTATDDTITVTITVSDTNSQPTFNDGTSTTRSVAENSAAVVNVGSPVAATDADGSDTLTYTMTGTDASSFTIVGTTGQIKTKTSLNREAKSSYSVTVKVTDSKNAAGSADTTIDDEISVTINVTDVNEAPTATADSVTVNEDSGTTEIPVTSNDTDPENDSLTASIVTNPTKGTASLKSGSSTVIEYTPNANANGSDSFTYKVNDGALDSAAATVSITINAVNDEPVFSEGATTTRSITVAGSTANSAVGAVLGVTHPDTGDTLTFGIGGTDASKFVVSSSGQISVGTSNLPAGTQQSYTVTVTVRDSKNAAGTADTATDDTITVTINITGANRVPAFASGTATRSVAETAAVGSNVGAPLAATDADNDTLTYTMTGTDAASFDFESGASGGQIKTKAALDASTKSSYSVTVNVSDGKNASGTADASVDASVAVTITVTEVDASISIAPWATPAGNPHATRDGAGLYSGDTANFAVSGQDWTSTSLYGVFCAVPSGGVAAITNSDCDYTSRVAITPSGGSFSSVTLTYTTPSSGVPADGVAIRVSNSDGSQAPTESATILAIHAPAVIDFTVTSVVKDGAAVAAPQSEDLTALNPGDTVTFSFTSSKWVSTVPLVAVLFCRSPAGELRQIGLGNANNFCRVAETGESSGTLTQAVANGGWQRTMTYTVPSGGLPPYGVFISAGDPGRIQGQAVPIIGPGTAPSVTPADRDSLSAGDTHTFTVSGANWTAGPSTSTGAWKMGSVHGEFCTVGSGGLDAITAADCSAAGRVTITVPASGPPLGSFSGVSMTYTVPPGGAPDRGVAIRVRRDVDDLSLDPPHTLESAAALAVPAAIKPLISVPPADRDTLSPGSTQTFSVTGTNWTDGPLEGVFCTIPAAGVGAITTSDCDTASPVAITVTGGSFTVTMVYTVPDSGVPARGWPSGSPTAPAPRPTPRWWS